jgi:hypothetical protein
MNKPTYTGIIPGKNVRKCPKCGQYVTDWNFDQSKNMCEKCKTKEEKK